MADPLYAEIEITDNWVENAIANDDELLTSMLEQPECMDTSRISDVTESSTRSDITCDTTVHTNVQNSCSVSVGDPVSNYYISVLESFVRQHGFTIHDVPRDGNCLFSSVVCQLYKNGYCIDEYTLRQMVVRYMIKIIMNNNKLSVSCTRNTTKLNF